MFEKLILTKDDLAFYYLDGTEVKRGKKLVDTSRRPQDHKEGKYELLFIDFKNILVLRILGSNDVFNFARLDTEMTLDAIK